MSNFLTLHNIGYSYHSPQEETAALHHINFSVREGEFIAIVGPSGCGKSTLLSIIAGLLLPEEGEISFNCNAGSNIQRPIGYMLQKDQLLEWRTIEQNVMLGLEITKQKTPMHLEYVNTLLKEYGLDRFRHCYPSQLSGGMKQRAALIRTLALKPDLLLLDEPFSALDYQTRLNVSSDICRLIRQTKKTVILITHDLAEAISLSDRIIVLSKRPATVIRNIPIQLSSKDNSYLSASKCPEFHNYFNLLWEDLNHENSTNKQ